MNRNTRTRFTAAKNRGFSLLEILVVAALVAAGLAALFALVNIYNQRQTTNAEASALNTIAAETRATFRSQGNFTGITPAVLIANGLVPATMVNGTNIETGWNTNVTVVPANLNGTMGDAVTFTYTLPRAACSRFVQAAEGAFPRVTIGGVAVKDVPAGANALNVVTMGAQCNAGAGGNVAIALTLGR